MGSNGMKTDELEDRVRRLLPQGRKIKLIYTIPTEQDLSEIIMSLDRRKLLLEIESRRNVLILEDLAYNYIFYGESPPIIKSIDYEGWEAM